MNPLVAEYLARLDAALSPLSPARRDEIVEDIRTHIEAELAGRHDVSDAEVRTLLDRIGSPSDIAAAAGGDDVAPTAVIVRPRARVGGYEIAAILLLLIGGFALFIGWVVGVVLLWSSAAWRIRDKLVGTLLVPGGLVPVVMFTLLVAGGTISRLGGDVFWICLIGPLFSACWLGYHANRHRPEPDEPQRTYADAVS